MKLTPKTCIWFIILSFVVAIIGAIPMIINRDDSYLTATVIISILLFVVGLLGLMRRARS